MNGFINLTLPENEGPVTIAVAAIGFVQATDWQGKSYTSITLCIPGSDKGGPCILYVQESYADVLKQIEQAKAS